MYLMLNHVILYRKRHCMPATIYVYASLSMYLWNAMGQMVTVCCWAEDVTMDSLNSMVSLYLISQMNRKESCSGIISRKKLLCLTLLLLIKVFKAMKSKLWLMDTLIISRMLFIVQKKMPGACRIN